MEIMSKIIEILVGGITGVASGIGSGLTALVNNLFVTADGALTQFGLLTIIFAGISLALGLCRLVVNWVTGLGGGNM